MVDLANMDLNKEAKIKVAFDNGQLVLELAYDGKGFDGTIKVAIDPTILMQEIGNALKAKA
jgi:hypothetical protein